jgi:hypothetical protein
MTFLVLRDDEDDVDGKGSELASAGSGLKR